MECSELALEVDRFDSSDLWWTPNVLSKDLPLKEDPLSSVATSPGATVSIGISSALELGSSAPTSALK